MSARTTIAAALRRLADRIDPPRKRGDRARRARANNAQAVQEIRGALKRRGLTVRGWALARGYAPRTVYACLDTWAGRSDRAPLGGINQQIIADLAKDIGIPEHLTDAATRPAAARSRSA